MQDRFFSDGRCGWLRAVLPRRCVFGNHQKAAGVFVEAVDEFEITRFGTGTADLFDDAEAHAAAAVDGDAGRFVNDQKRIVFVNDVKLARRRGLAFRRPLFSAMRIGGMRTVSPA